MLDPTIRTRFLHLPTQQQQLQNMQECYAKYKLPNIIGGIDGCHIPFLERPRQIPGGRDHVAFINRKGMYSINAQIVGGIDRKIYDIQLSSPGSYHDSATYTMSMFKGWLETRNELGGYVLGDSAYPLSTYLLTPYDENESQECMSKCLFNVRHSQCRVEQTENIYGMLKRRFPLVKYIRVQLNNAVRITTAAAVLHNMAVEWNEVQPVIHENPQEHPVIAAPAQQMAVRPAEQNQNVRRDFVIQRDVYRLNRMDQNISEAENFMILNHRAAVAERRDARRAR